MFLNYDPPSTLYSKLEGRSIKISHYMEWIPTKVETQQESFVPEPTSIWGKEQSWQLEGEGKPWSKRDSGPESGGRLPWQPGKASTRSDGALLSFTDHPYAFPSPRSGIWL